jgi:hypothetical protein
MLIPGPGRTVCFHMAQKASTDVERSNCGCFKVGIKLIKIAQRALWPCMPIAQRGYVERVLETRSARLVAERELGTGLNAFWCQLF